MKILYVTTVSGTINAFLTHHIKMLIDLGHKVDIACSVTRPVDSKLLEYGCNVYDVGFSRSPLSERNVNGFKKLKKVIINGEYDLVHTHTPVASTITRLICKNIKTIKVVYTAHGFHFFKGAPLKNWLIYYPIEKKLSKYTDVLITINKEDYNRAKEKLDAKFVKYIPGIGLNIEEIKKNGVVKKTKRKEIQISENAFVLLSVGELNRNKNHEVVIKAIAQLNDPEIQYVICGVGPLKQHLKNLISELGLTKQVHLLGLRKDIIEICKSADIFVFPSFREGLSVALMESMASGLPVLCSDIRGNNDLIIPKHGGLYAHPKDIEEWAENIHILKNDKSKRIKFGSFNSEYINEFSNTNVIKELQEVYTELFEV